MNSPTVPGYPVIYVDVQADGSAHINVAGRHIDTPAAPLPETRATVIRYAVEIAVTLGRVVRMTTTDPAGTFHIAVHPTGTVTELTATDRPKRTTQQRTSPQSTPAELVPEATPPPQRVSATLTFSTGDTVTIHTAALVGRRPHASGGSVDQLVPITDSTLTVSKTHFRIQRIDDRFWITDQGTANGTTLRRTECADVELEAAVPHRLHSGDTALIGDVTFTVTLHQSPPTGL